MLCHVARPHGGFLPGGIMFFGGWGKAAWGRFGWRKTGSWMADNSCGENGMMRIDRKRSMKKKATKNGKTRIPEVVADEKDFASVLDIITTHRSRALMSVNVESLLTYWEIGAFLSPRIHSGSWSTAVVGKLADYIKRNKPELRGYGKSNLYNMALVYETFSSDAFVSVLDKYSAQLSQYRNIFQTLVGKRVTTTPERSGKDTNVIKTVTKEVTHQSDFFQPMVGKSVPEILFSLSFVKQLLIAAHVQDVQELLFYVVYAIRERLTKEELRQCLAHDAYTSLLGGNKKNY